MKGSPEEVERDREGRHGGKRGLFLSDLGSVRRGREWEWKRGQSGEEGGKRGRGGMRKGETYAR